MGNWYFLSIPTKNTSRIWHTGGDYASTHNAAVGSVVPGEGQTAVGHSESGTPNIYRIYRPGFTFVTSMLPDGDSITAAVLSLNFYPVTPDVDVVVNVVNGDDLESPPVGADYGDLLNDTTSFGLFTYTGISDAGRHDLALDAAGKAKVSKTGNTKYGLRSSGEINSVVPGNAESHTAAIRTSSVSTTGYGYFGVILDETGVQDDRATIGVKVEPTSDDSFRPPILKVTTDGATSGSNLSVRFGYWETADYGTLQYTSWQDNVAWYTNITAEITGLKAGTEYMWRAFYKVADDTVDTMFFGHSIFTTLESSYPSDARARVTGLIHRWSPGNFSLEAYFGDVVTEWNIADYLGPAAPSIPPGVVEGPKYPTGPGYPQQDPGYVPPVTPKVIACPGGYRMVYDLGDVDRQFPHCVPDPSAVGPYAVQPPVLLPIPTPTLEAAKIAAKIIVTPGALPAFVETVTGALSSYYKGTVLGKVYGMVSTVFKAMNPFNWFGR